MAFKLTKDEEAQRKQIVEKLRLEATHLKDAVHVFNAAHAALRDRLDTARQAYNSTLEEARTFVGEVQGRLTDKYDGKSEKWKVSNRCREVESWIEEWTDAVGSAFADVDDFEYTTLDDPEIEDADTLQNLKGKPL